MLLIILLFARCVADAASIVFFCYVIVSAVLFGSCCRFSLLLLPVCSYPLLVVPVVLVVAATAAALNLITCAGKQQRTAS